MTKHETINPGLRAAFAVASDLERKSQPEPLEVLSKQFSDVSAAVQEHMKKTSSGLSILKAQMDDMEQKNARDGGGPEHVETWGQQFTKTAADQLETMVRDRNVKASVQVKAVTTGLASGGPLIIPVRDAPNMMPQQRLTIRALLPVINIGSGTVEYVQQDSRPTGAAPVAEGAAKPESNMTFSLETSTARVIAHWIKASRQVLEDAPQLSSMIDLELRYGLALAEEVQILNGDGTGQNLNGLMTNATAFTDAAGIIGAGANYIDVIGAAILQSALADFPPTGVVVHWADWWRMLLTKDGEGNYILGSPQSMAMPQMWGLPVIPTKAIAAGNFLVGSFETAATLYDRWSPRVEVGYVNDDFTKNMVTILAEQRVALAVKNGAALITGDFATALAL